MRRGEDRYSADLKAFHPRIKGISAKWPPLVRSEMTFLPMSIGRVP
jgi:hypothetical protein